MAASRSSVDSSPSNHDSTAFSISSPYVTIDPASRTSSTAKHSVDLDQYRPPEKRLRQSTTSPSSGRHEAVLPASLWQHIFTYLSPECLARLLRVNHAFKAYLVSEQPPALELSHRSATHPLPPEEVWAASRELYYPHVLRPLAGRSELDMWKLIKGRGCTICDEPYLYSTGGFPFEAGPHNDTVRVIWPFAIRCCRSCLREGSQTDESLLLSDASAVVPTLPFAFITKKHHIVSSAVLQSGNHIPPTLAIRKIYYTKNVEEMQNKLEVARSISTDRAKDRFEELKAQKASRLRDVENWERWEQNGGLQGLAMPSTPPNMSRPGSSQPSSKTPTWSLSRPSSGVEAGGQRPFSRPSAHTPSKERGYSEIQEAKAIRRQEIEQRCHDLNPPIHSSLLEHMESFQAAIQIPSPLTARDWDLLKPRILSQRSVAEQRGAEIESSRERQEERRQQDLSIKEIKEASDKQWENNQSPIRDQLGEYADEIIRNEWAEGATISGENAPQFAAAVLLHVRRRFYSDLVRENRANSESSASKRLVLDNMKWVYDTKIKPLTEKFRKDLFLCNVCGQNAKTFSFDGVIQHYGAKHTNDFTVGDTVVHWRSGLWPETPPFAPVPDMKTPAAQNGHSTPGHIRHGSNHHPGQFQRPFYVPNQGPFGVTNIGPNASPGPYGNFAFPNSQDTGHFGPFQPPAPFYSGHPLTNHDPRSYSPVWSQIRGQTPSQQMYYQSTSPGPTTPFGQSGWPAPPAENAFSSQIHGGMMPPPGFGRNPTDHSLYPVQGNAYMQGTGSFYQEQLEYLAYIANDVWTTLSTVRSMSPSVRLYVTIHHVVSRFSNRFSNEPSLDLFYECLNNSPSMALLKSVHDLACKTCVVKNESSPEPHSNSFAYKSGERRLYPFLSLLSHFKNVHVQPLLSSDNSESKSPEEKPDWKEDMIELPSDAYIEGLRNTPGMDNDKFEYIAKSFPHIFHLQISTMSEHRGRTNASSDRSSPSTTRKRERNASDDTGMDERRPPMRRVKVNSPPSQSPPVAREDEYDPRRPAYLEREQYSSTKDADESALEEDAPPKRVSRGPLHVAPTLSSVSDSEMAGYDSQRTNRRVVKGPPSETAAERFLAEFTPDNEHNYMRRDPLPRDHSTEQWYQGGREGVRVVRAAPSARDERYIMIEAPSRRARDEMPYERLPPGLRYEVQYEDTSHSRPVYVRSPDVPENDFRYGQQPHQRVRYYDGPVPEEPAEYVYVRRRDGAVYRPNEDEYGTAPGSKRTNELKHDATGDSEKEPSFYADEEDLPDAPTPPRSANRSKH